MSKRVLVINGHPDGAPERFCAALAQTYAQAAEAAGHEVHTLSLAKLDFPLIHTRSEFESAAPPPAIAEAQKQIAWAQHVVIVHPLWLGSAPALLKAFMEQTFRYGFALPKLGPKGMPKGLLSGRSVRLLVTMGMPGFMYRTLFGGFGVRAMERGILRLAGMGPIRHAFIGLVEGPPSLRSAWLNRVRSWARGAV